jgi:hypothetical protein
VLQYQTQVVLLLQNPKEANHLAQKKGGWHKNETKKKKAKKIEEEEELDEDQDKQKNEEGELKDVKPEN